ncbi:hypothetical protein CEXT_18681 [Caerostris extrusa]|uniref:LAGLIDADG homing endonuclease n=1 Tax=Caerostris extrusa TaxID=172846 RepID=A0AAV4Q344_CAEEX|nr:hypothetical protein CEXT_18681 [Caerostris extrusa]
MAKLWSAKLNVTFKSGQICLSFTSSCTRYNRLLIPVTIADGICHKANILSAVLRKGVSVLLARLHQVRIHSSSSNSRTCVAWFIKFTKPQHTNVHFASIECGSSIICYLNKDGLLNVKVFECCWTMAAEKHYNVQTSRTRLVHNLRVSSSNETARTTSIVKIPVPPDPKPANERPITQSIVGRLYYRAGDGNYPP